jgi:hypothetical protein
MAQLYPRALGKRFQVLTVLVMNSAIFRDTALCSTYVSRRFRGTWPGIPAACHILARLTFDAENGGDTFLRNVGSHTHYTALYPRGWQRPIVRLDVEMSAVTWAASCKKYVFISALKIPFFWGI